MASTYIQEAGSIPSTRATLGLADPDHAAASGVSWAAVLAGATAAAALSLIMVLLGTGMGLGMTSPWEGEGAEAKTVGIAAIFWITFTQVAASGLGGYLAGRLRRKWTGLHTEEAGFRDTAHGFLAWGVATLVTAALLASAVGSTVSVGAKAGMTVVSGVAGGAITAAGGAAAASPGEDAGGGPMGYWVDSLFRKDPGAASAPASPDAGGAPMTGAPASQAGATAEVGRILTRGLRTGSLAPEDSRYVAQLVAQRTGLSQADAEKRVNDTYARAKAALDEAQAKAKAAADAARKATAYASLWIFLSLVIGALVAAYCASLGGRNRDL